MKFEELAAHIRAEQHVIAGYIVPDEMHRREKEDGAIERLVRSYIGSALGDFIAKHMDTLARIQTRQRWMPCPAREYLVDCIVLSPHDFDLMVRELRHWADREIAAVKNERRASL